MLSMLPDEIRSLVWENEITFFTTSHDGPYFIKPSMVIRKESRMGSYLEDYLTQRDFTFKENLLQNWEISENLFGMDFGLVLKSMDQFDLDLLGDRFFPSYFLLNKNPQWKILVNHFMIAIMHLKFHRLLKR